MINRRDIESVFELLARDLCYNTTLSYDQAVQVVEFLESNEFIDYDTLKDIYLFDGDDDD